MPQFRALTERDRPELDTFLQRHADTTMFLRSNLYMVGLTYEGKVFEAEYVGAFEKGRLVGVAAHAWNHNLLVQAEQHLDALVCQTVSLSRRPVAGFLGPVDQVKEAIAALHLEGIEPMHFGNDDLYGLDLLEMSLPSKLQSGDVVCRGARTGDLSRLTEWRVAYCAEVLGDQIDDQLREEARELILKLHEQGDLWVLEDQGHLVAMTAFNAKVPDCVQVGGVWTPPEQRGRGFARSVVAGSLVQARDRGVRRGILFTDNPAASRAYESIGFRKIGTFGFVLFHDPVMVGASISR